MINEKAPKKAKAQGVRLYYPLPKGGRAEREAEREDGGDDLHWTHRETRETRVSEWGRGAGGGVHTCTDTTEVYDFFRRYKSKTKT